MNTSLHIRQRGFTLIELMVVVGIIGIMATISIGVGGRWLRRDQAAREAREIYQGLNLARSEAVKRGSTVKVEINAAPGVMTVFRDDNADDVYSLGEGLLYTYPKSGTWLRGVTINTSLLTGRNIKPVAIFDSNGFSVDRLGQPFGSGITITDNDPEGASFRIELSIAGALRIQ